MTPVRLRSGRDDKGERVLPGIWRHDTSLPFAPVEMTKGSGCFQEFGATRRSGYGMTGFEV